MIVDKNTKIFLTILFILSVLGIVMVYSSSYMYAMETFGTSLHFVLRQVIYFILGVSIAFLFSKSKADFWYKNTFLFHIFFGLLVCLTFTPLGVSIKGASRWISFPFFNFQPSEFIKITTITTSFYFFDNFHLFSRDEKIKKGILLLFPLVAVLLQPDFGTFSISFIVILFSAFISRFKRSYFLVILLTGLICVASILIAAPYRIRRLLVFLNPWDDPQNSGFQIIQSFLAFANGHIFGLGIGNSNEKLFYLPEAYNDFILSVIGEELGFVGILFVVVLFLLFLYYGFKIASSVPNRIHSTLMSSIIFIISIQAILNMGVVLGLLPTKGLNLPFISYGGSSLLANMVALGIFFSLKNNKSKIDDLDFEPHTMSTNFSY